MYETGTTCSAMPASVSTSQHSATCSAVAMSAMEHPAASVRQDHFWSSEVRMSATPP